MEKYGVDQTDESEEKTSQDQTTCASCGAVLQQHGRVHLCPKCGSEPLESNIRSNPAYK